MAAAPCDQESETATDCDALRLQLQQERVRSSQLQDDLQWSRRCCDYANKAFLEVQRERDALLLAQRPMTGQEREWEGYRLLAIECQRTGGQFHCTPSTPPTSEQLARIIQVYPGFQYQGRLAGPGILKQIASIFW